MHPFTPSCYDPHWALYPRTYVAPRVPLHSITIDGNLDKEPWNDTRIAWSAPFQDIQGGSGTGTGAPITDDSKIPVTRFKAAWDDENLYVAAMLHPAEGFATEAHFTDRNSPIYQRDSDFEIFVDPSGTTHNYKELEINAINTVWNLLLDKPYGDGGHEHSGRIAKPGDDMYWDVSSQKTAATVLEGKLNDPTHRGALWCVELSLSIRDLLNRCHHPHDALQPRTHSHWRINFSRVEKKGDINWTWQPQVVWDPALKAFAGKVQMHLPDAWGYLLFGKALESTNARGSNECEASNDCHQHARDPSWPHRLAAMNVYYALHAYKEQRGAFTPNMDDLSVDQAIVQPFDVQIQCTDDTFLVTVRGRVDLIAATVRDDRLLQVSSSDAQVVNK